MYTTMLWTLMVGMVQKALEEMQDMCHLCWVVYQLLRRCILVNPSCNDIIPLHFWILLDQRFGTLTRRRERCFRSPRWRCSWPAWERCVKQEQSKTCWNRELMYVTSYEYTPSGMSPWVTKGLSGMLGVSQCGRGIHKFVPVHSYWKPSHFLEQLRIAVFSMRAEYMCYVQQQIGLGRTYRQTEVTSCSRLIYSKHNMLYAKYCTWAHCHVRINVRNNIIKECGFCSTCLSLSGRMVVGLSTCWVPITIFM